MEVTVIRPRHERLIPFIECYYILHQEAGEKASSYITYPSIYTIVAAVANARFEVRRDSILTLACAGSRPVSSLVAHFQRPLRFIYEGEISEITIYFKPNGINAFLDRPLCNYSQIPFNYFEPWADYTDALSKILQYPGDDEKINSLEDYLVTKCQHIPNLLVEKILHSFMRPESDDPLSLAELCRQFKISRKTAHQLFMTHMGQSPTAFRKTLRFREALSKASIVKRQAPLTDLAHSSRYYDQSHMLKDFRSLTLQQPKAFFKTVSAVHEKLIFWRLE